MIQASLIFLLILTTDSFAFDWQGHRGARGLYPENTIGAMEEALKYPVTTLEMDVVVSKDMKVVVSHEPWMNEEICIDPQGKKFVGKKHNLFKMTYEDIMAYDCGSKVHPRFPQQKKVTVGKPTLEQLISITEATLKRLNRSEVQYNIEIKSTSEDEQAGFQPDYKTFSDLVLTTIKEKLPVTKFTIQSFDWRVLKFIHQMYPDVRLVALSEDVLRPEEDLKKLGFNPFVFSPDYKNLTKAHIDFFHGKKIKVIPWTVNEVPEMEKLIKLGVDGIITDYPDRIPEVGSKDCKSGYHLFEGKCVKLPAHSLPADHNPGWTCKPGHVQKRAYCEKIKMPKHSHLTPDGKNWECDEGYKRYRSSCKKFSK